MILCLQFPTTMCTLHSVQWRRRKKKRDEERALRAVSGARGNNGYGRSTSMWWVNLLRLGWTQLRKNQIHEHACRSQTFVEQIGEVGAGDRWGSLAKEITEVTRETGGRRRSESNCGSPKAYQRYRKRRILRNNNTSWWSAKTRKNSVVWGKLCCEYGAC